MYQVTIKVVQVGWGCEIAGELYGVNKGKLDLRFSDSPQSNQLSNTVIPLNTWANIGFVYKTTSRVVTFYLNGVADGAPTMQYANTAPIGSTRIGDRPTGGFSFKGLIDEVRIYNRALTATEIQEHYTLGRRSLKLGN